jgi:hypothetical protein
VSHVNNVSKTKTTTLAVSIMFVCFTHLDFVLHNSINVKRVALPRQIHRAHRPRLRRQRLAMAAMQQRQHLVQVENKRSGQTFGHGLSFVPACFFCVLAVL